MKEKIPEENGLYPKWGYKPRKYESLKWKSSKDSYVTTGENGSTII